MEKAQKKAAPKKEEPIKIKGSFDDVIGLSVGKPVKKAALKKKK